MRSGRVATWALKHPWKWTALWAVVLYVAWTIIFRVTLSRDFGEDLVVAELPVGLFWLAFGSGISFLASRRKP
ncbi:MAG: hypothetical protein LC808_18840 [Actinobacteria bacterium]|nr:hypothetical protein [Actinomycetota bacterium]